MYKVVTWLEIVVTLFVPDGSEVIYIGRKLKTCVQDLCAVCQSGGSGTNVFWNLMAKIFAHPSVTVFVVWIETRGAGVKIFGSSSSPQLTAELGRWLLRADWEMEPLSPVSCALYNAILKTQRRLSSLRSGTVQASDGGIDGLQIEFPLHDASQSCVVQVVTIWTPEHIKASFRVLTHVAILPEQHKPTYIYWECRWLEHTHTHDYHQFSRSDWMLIHLVPPGTMHGPICWRHRWSNRYFSSEDELFHHYYIRVVKRFTY